MVQPYVYGIVPLNQSLDYSFVGVTPRRSYFVCIIIIYREHIFCKLLYQIRSSKMVSISQLALVSCILHAIGVIGLS